MNIILNGNAYVNGEHYYFDELEIQIEDQFEEFEEEIYCCNEECCDECNECEENFEEILGDYAVIIADNCCCTDCIKDVLRVMIDELLEVD